MPIQVKTSFDILSTDLNKELVELTKKFGPKIVNSRVFSPVYKTWAETVLEPFVQQSLSNQRLRRRSGQLATRTTVELGNITSSGGETETLVASVVTRNVPYAFIQEHGGTITPKKSKFLAIPLSAARTPAGGSRGDPRDFKNTFVAKSKQGNLIIFQKNNVGSRSRSKRAENRSDITPLFVLKRSVTIPASRWASGATADALKQLPGLLEASFDRYFEQAGR